ncbi:hypothetical protein AB6E21_20540 [Photobacterium swingsii]|uniref:hypothetical protein n=1 Tax=Photobacterium swingsii TaxID=680026 RepID=UPI003553AEB2
MKKLSVIALATLGLLGSNVASAAEHSQSLAQPNAAPVHYTNPAKDFLSSKLGLSPSDVEMLFKYHEKTVLEEFRNRDNLLFGNIVPLNSSSFMAPNTIGNQPIGTDYHLVNWDSQSIAAFKDTLGRVVFLMNTPEFRKDFNRNIYTVEPQSSVNTQIPTNYAQFKNYINTAAASYGNHIKAYVSDSNTKSAWGANGLLIQFEQSGINPAQVAHELMHSVGYAHDGVYNGLNDNIPYLVQTIISMNEDASNICPNKASKCDAHNVNWGEFYNSDDNNTYRPATAVPAWQSIALLGKYFNHVS